MINPEITNANLTNAEMSSFEIETNNKSIVTNFPTSIHQGNRSPDNTTLQECIFKNCNSYFESDELRKSHELVCKFSEVINLDEFDEECDKDTHGSADINKTFFTKQDINPVEIIEQPDSSTKFVTDTVLGQSENSNENKNSENDSLKKLQIMSCLKDSMKVMQSMKSVIESLQNDSFENENVENSSKLKTYRCGFCETEFPTKETFRMHYQVDPIQQHENNHLNRNIICRFLAPSGMEVTSVHQISLFLR